LIALIEKKVGAEADIVHHPFPKADMLANLADVSKAGSHLGWEPAVSLEEGISRTIAWYNDNRDWARLLELNI
jgi:UDP-glucuronate decarboxylase